MVSRNGYASQWNKVGMFMVFPRDAWSKICPYNIKGVWSHSMGDMPTPFLFTTWINSCGSARIAVKHTPMLTL